MIMCIYIYIHMWIFELAWICIYHSELVFLYLVYWFWHIYIYICIYSMYIYRYVWIMVCIHEMEILMESGKLKVSTSWVYMYIYISLWIQPFSGRVWGMFHYNLGKSMIPLPHLSHFCQKKTCGWYTLWLFNIANWNMSHL